MGRIRATNHHGRSKASKPSSPKHIDRNRLKEARHIDPARTSQNRYWLWQGEWKQPGDCEAAERAYYREAFQDGQEAQNERYRRKGNHGRVRTTDQVYDNSTTRPEGTLLYIGSLRDGRVDPDDLWACALEYRAWEEAESEAKGGFYKPLSMALHVDEDGQYHVELHGVYQYRDADGHLRPGQNAALEAAGFGLPDPDQPRSRYNNRKMTWDAARREAWLDILEAHKYDVERTPEAQRPHMGLEAWQAYQDAKGSLDTQAAAQAAQQAALDAQAEAQSARQSDLESQANAQAAQQASLDAQAAQQRRIANAQQDQAAKIQQQAQQVQAARESTKKWAADLTEWRDREQQRLTAAAAQVAKAATGSDAALLAELDRRHHKDGRTWREALTAELESRAAAQPITIKRPPGQDDIAAAMQLAQEQEQRRLQARQQGKQLGG